LNQKQVEFKVAEKEIGQRIDLYLSLRLEDMSRSYISKLIEQGKVKVNQQGTTKSYKVREGDLIVVTDTGVEPATDLAGC